MLKKNWENYAGIAVILFAVLKYYVPFFGFTSLIKYMMVLSLVLSTALIAKNIRKFNIIHFVLILIFGLQFVMSKNITILYTYYLCMAVYVIDFRFMMKWFITINIVLFTAFMATNLLGINPTEYLEGRNDFGFGNPNTSFICMFIIWSSYFYYIFYSEKKIDYILMFSMVFLMYTQTMTRTGLLTAVGTVVAFMILKLIDVRKKYCKILIGSFPMLMTILSLFITVFMSDNYLINKVLSHRPVYWKSYIMHPEKGINLFGYSPNIRDILFTQRMPLDSGYIWTLYSSGVIVYVIIILLMCYTLYKLCEEDKKDQILLMVSILIYCFAESIMVDLTANISLVLIIYGILKLGVKKTDFKKLSNNK